MNGFNKGALSPLLFNWRILPALAGLLFLTACSHSSQESPFTATGYIADKGVIRLWRKNTANGALHMLAVFSPYGKGTTQTTDYRWQDDKLISMERHISGEIPETIHIRFDSQGNLSFMQHEKANKKEQISSDMIALYQYEADKIRTTSETLRSGKVSLLQGLWHRNGTITLCEGKTIEPDLDNAALRHIQRRQQHSSTDVSVAWLEAPEGSQLLLVANEDFCRWQPQEQRF